MIFHFGDGSYFEESTTYTQHQVFRMESYHLVQRGPAFAADLDAMLSRDGRYVVTSTSHKGGKAERYAGRLDLPSDTYNGLPIVAAMNLRLGDTVTIHLVAFTPKPRLIGLRIAFRKSKSPYLSTGVPMLIIRTTRASLIATSLPNRVPKENPARVMGSFGKFAER